MYGFIWSDASSRCFGLTSGMAGWTGHDDGLACLAALNAVPFVFYDDAPQPDRGSLTKAE